jgi:Protein of unknown function with HXXEE motif
MSMDWFARNWMYAGLVAVLFLLALVPLLVGAWSLPLLLVYLQLPIYLVHQVEEHHGDRFRQFVNDHIAGGLPALTTPAVVFINVPGVWGVNLLALYLARFVDLGLGLIAVYLTLVNALAHVASTLVLRRYNPGRHRAGAVPAGRLMGAGRPRARPRRDDDVSRRRSGGRARHPRRHPGARQAAGAGLAGRLSRRPSWRCQIATPASMPCSRRFILICSRSVY